VFLLSGLSGQVGKLHDLFIFFLIIFFIVNEDFKTVEYAAYYEYVPQLVNILRLPAQIFARLYCKDSDAIIGLIKERNSPVFLLRSGFQDIEEVIAIVSLLK